jgi:hypothetical protein
VVQPNELERYLSIAEAGIRESGGPGGVLVLLDSETDSACKLGPELLGRARVRLPHRSCQVVLPVKNFEAWLIGGRAVAVVELPNPEQVPTPSRVVEEALGRYRKTVDQPRLTARMDIDAAAASCPSFAKFLRALDAIDESR